MVLGQVSVELAEVPFHPQQDHHCGPASLLTVLEQSGAEASYDSIVEHVYVPKLEGSLQVELQAAARSFGRVAYVLPPTPEAVLAEVAAGRPVLVLLNLGLPSRAVWHYAVVVGYDEEANRIVLRSGQTERSQQKAPAWLRRWDWAGRWGIVLLRPGEWPATVDRERLLAALSDFEDKADPAVAERAWRRASEELPDEPYAWLGVGNVAAKMGRWDQARVAYSRALELAPDRVSVRYNLAYALGESGAPCAGVEVMSHRTVALSGFAAQSAQLVARLERECLSP